jgi:hypothetical protein
MDTDASIQHGHTTRPLTEAQFRDQFKTRGLSEQEIDDRVAVGRHGRHRNPQRGAHHQHTPNTRIKAYRDRLQITCHREERGSPTRSTFGFSFAEVPVERSGVVCREDLTVDA